jgi:ABC-2 type transport system permease protein
VSRAKPAAGPEVAQAPVRAELPTAWNLGLARAGIEIKQFFRERDAIAYGFSFPIVLLLMFGALFHSHYRGTDITVAHVYATGLMAAGLMVASFQNLGARITLDREDGTLKRLRGTPMPPSSYFIGKLLFIAVVSAIEVLLIFAVGVVAFGLPLPSTIGAYVAWAWVFALGLTASSLLGIAATSIVPNARSAHVVISGPLILLQFVSGVYVPFNEVPGWLYTLSSFFPLRWISQGFRAALLPQSSVLAPERSGHLGLVALVLGLWVVLGAVLVGTTFRWRRRGDN